MPYKDPQKRKEFQRKRSLARDKSKKNAIARAKYDAEAAKIRSKKYRTDHADEIKAKARAKYDAEAAKIRGKIYRENNPEKTKNRHLIRKYNITLEEYNLLKEQATHCPICEIEMVDENNQLNSKVLDHNHVSGIIRGFICNRCNWSLGAFNDDPNIIARALAWVS